jgi:hypothetical protein
MSVQAEPMFDVPELTAEIARAAFPKGNIWRPWQSGGQVYTQGVTPLPRIL